MKKGIVLCVGVFVALMAKTQVTSISVETYYSDDGTVADYPAGHVTYRIYANCTNPNDLVTAIVGTDTSPLTLSVPAGIWNHPLGGTVGTSVNASLFGIAPALRYDSFVTIGRSSNADPGSTIYVVEDPAQTWSFQHFNTVPYGAPLMSVNTIIGGTWFGLPGDANVFAGAGLKILLAQITTQGPVCGTFNLQVFPNWQGLGNPDIFQADLSFGTSVCGFGCTDPLALNYDSEAGYPDNSCLYACDLQWGTLNIAPPTCDGLNDGSIYFEGTGGQGEISYQFNGTGIGAGPGQYNSLGNGTYVLTITDSRFSDQSINPGEMYGTCSLTETVDFDVQPIQVFNLTAESVSCAGAQDGCVVAEVSGGTGTLSVSLQTCDNQLVQSGLSTTSACGLGGGSYAFFVSDTNGCEATSTCVTVVQPTPLVISGLLAIPINDTPGGSSDYTVTGGTEPYSYFWTDAQGNLVSEDPVLSGLTDPTEAGTYTITVVDANGCQVTRVLIITDVVNLENTFHAALLPNPTMGPLMLSLSGLTGDRVVYRITDARGRLIQSKDLGHIGGERLERLDVSAFDAGIYFVQILSGRSIHTLKMVKE